MKLDKLTLKEISGITKEFYENEIIFNADFKVLFLNFLYKVTGENIWGMSFADIRDLYINNLETKSEDIPDIETDFYKYIIGLYFGLDKPPYLEILKYYRLASSDLKEVDKRIINIENEIKDITANKNTVDIQSKVPVLHYFLNLNKEAREEILNFLKFEIKAYSLRQCDPQYKNIYKFPNVPYNYNFNPKAYDVRYPSLISNKFKDLTIENRKIVEDYYKDADNRRFRDFVCHYIEQESIIEKIEFEIDNGHIINKRGDIIRETISIFENGNKIVFAGICTFIIEGIFHDICLLFDEDENKLLGAGFQEKVNILNSKMSFEFDYEYYSFKFRLLRNKMAHGLIDGRESKEIADLLLLDLFDAIEISKSNMIPLNQKLFFVYQTLKDRPPENYNYLAGYCFLKHIEIPDFYNTASDENKINEIANSEELWIFIDNCLCSNDIYKKSFAQCLVKTLKDLKLDNINEKCVLRLQTMVTTGVPKFNKEKFILKLIGHNY